MLDAVTIAYFVLSISGGQAFLIPLLVTCLVSKRVHRHPLLLEFLACWVIYSLATCMLLYSGHQGDDDIPHSLCLAQAALVNGSLIMAAIAAFTLVLHLRLTMPRDNKPITTGVGPRMQLFLSSFPVVSFAIYELTLLGVELAKPGSLLAERRDLICGFRSSGQAYLADRISPIIIGVFLFISLGLSSFMFTLTFSARKGVTSRSQSAPWMRVLLRFTIFAGYAGLTAIACVCRIALPDSPALHTVVAVYVATLPLAAFLVFGTLPDVLEAWHLRKHRTQAETGRSTHASAPGALSSNWEMHTPSTMGRAHLAVRWDVATPHRISYPPGLERDDDIEKERHGYHGYAL